MTRLTAAPADASASAAGPTNLAGLAAHIHIPRRLPIRYDGQPIRHLSNSSYSRWLLCQDDWRRYYLLRHRTAPSGAMFLGGRVDDAISTYYRRILEHHEQLSVDQVKDAYRDHWHAELAAEEDKLGIDWGPELSEAATFEMGLAAIELTLAELVPKLGQPTAVQRKLEFALAPGLEWTIQCYLDLETLQPMAARFAPRSSTTRSRAARSHSRRPTTTRKPAFTSPHAGSRGRRPGTSPSRRSRSPGSSESR